MNYEKAYKEALAKAKKWYNAPNADKIPTYANRIIVEIFPELKESEDERIRKALIRVLNENVGNGIEKYGAKLEDAIAWLEKQGEQKVPINDFKAKNWYVSEVDGKIHDMTYNPADKVEPKFHEGDWVVYIGTTAKILDLQKHCYVGKDVNDKDFVASYCNECEMKKWTIQDAKDGDVLACGDKVTDCPFIFHNLTKELNPRSYCGVNTLCHFQDNDENGGFWCKSDEVRPATKEQRDLLFQKMEEAGYEWSDKDRKLIKIVK